MTDDDFGLEAAVLDIAEKFGHELLRVGLTHAKPEALLESVAEQETVNRTRVDAGDAYHSTSPHGSDGLPQRLSAATFQLQTGQHCLGGAPFGLKSNGIDDSVRAPIL